MRKILILFLILSLVPVLPIYADTVQPFNDIEGHWAYENIMKLYNAGIINGTAEGKFEPYSNITRSEFAKLVRTAMKLELIEGNSFKDMQNNWAKNEVHTLVLHGGISKAEYGENFYPYKNITRLEMAKIIVRSVGMNDEAIEKTGNETPFVDDKLIAPADKGYILIASENKIINGLPDRTFNPNGEATRAEASQMIVNMLNYLKSKEEASMEPEPTPIPVPNPTPVDNKEAEMEKRILDGTYTYEDVEWKREIEIAKQEKDSNYIMQPIFKIVHNPNSSIYCYIYILNAGDYKGGTELKVEHISHPSLNTLYAPSTKGLQVRDMTVWRNMTGRGIEIEGHIYSEALVVNAIPKNYNYPDELKDKAVKVKIGDTITKKITIKRGSNSKEYILNITIK